MNQETTTNHHFLGENASAHKTEHFAQAGLCERSFVCAIVRICHCFLPIETPKIVQHKSIIRFGESVCWSFWLVRNWSVSRKWTDSFKQLSVEQPENMRRRYVLVIYWFIDFLITWSKIQLQKQHTYTENPNEFWELKNIWAINTEFANKTPTYLHHILYINKWFDSNMQAWYKSISHIYLHIQRISWGCSK